MYKLNNIPFLNFGISPARIGGSNIAVAGMLDMPPRIGKVYHNWTGESGVEPYVSVSEIKHGARTVEIQVFMRGSDKVNVYGMLETFYKEIGSFSGLVTLETPYSSHQVYIKEGIGTEYLNEGWLKLKLLFEEPVVPNPAVLPVGVETVKPHFDGVALDSLGMFLTGFKDHLNRPRTKDQQFTGYDSQGFQITPAEALEFELELIAYADSFGILKQNIQSLQKLLSAPGMRKIKVDNQNREVFNIKGFSVSNIKVSGEFSLCRIKLPLMATKPGTPVQLKDLVSGNYKKIVSNLNKLIKMNSWKN